MKKVILGISLLVLVVVAVVAFIIIRSFNVDTYKAQIIDQLKQLTGREVTCDAEASLSWRPLPTFVVNNLTISNQDGSQTETMLSIKQIQVEIEWSSFFKSPLVVKRVVLKNPNVLLERIHSYQTNFSFPILFNPTQTFGDNSFVSSDNETLKIDTFEIEDGTFSYLNSITKDAWTIHHINGSGRVDSLNGPFAFNGTFDLLSNNFNATLETETLAVSRPFNFSLTLKDSSSGSNADISGVFAMDTKTDWLQLNGYFSSEKPQTLLSSLGFKNISNMNKTNGNFVMNINYDKILLKNLVLLQGEGENQFSCDFKFGTKSDSQKEIFSATINRLDYAEWKDILNVTIPTLIGRLPPDIEIDVKIAEIFWHNQSIKDFLIQGRMEKGELIATGSMQLPFEGQVNLNGKWNLKEVTGNTDIVLKTNNLRSFLQWAWGELPTSLPSVGLLSTELMGKLTFLKDEQNLEIQNLSIDDVKLHGSLKKSKEINLLNLEVQNLDLDSYYPDSTKKLTMQAVLNAVLEKIALLTENYEFNLSLNKILLSQTNLDHILLKGNVSKDLLNLDQLSIQSKSNIDLTLSGKCTELVSSTPQANNLRLDLDILDWPQVAQKFHMDQLPLVKSFDDLKGYITYSGSLNKENDQISLKTGTIGVQLKDKKSEIELSGPIQINERTGVSWNQIMARIQHPSFTEVVSDMSPRIQLSQNWDQVFDFKGTLSGNFNEISWSNATLSIGDNKFNSTGRCALSEVFDLQSKIEAEQLDISKILPPIKQLYASSNKPFTIQLDSSTKLDLDIHSKNFIYDDQEGTELTFKGKLENQKLDIKLLSFLLGKEAPGQFMADGLVDLRQGISLTGNIKGNEIPLPDDLMRFGKYALSKGSISGEAQVKSSGKTLFELARNAQGSGSLKWTQAIMSGMDATAWLNAVQSALAQSQTTDSFSSRLQYALTNGKTTLPDLSGAFKIDNGFLNFDALQGKNDLVSVSNGQLNWSLTKESSLVKLPVILTAISKLPPITFDLSHNSYAVQSVPFEQAFDAEIKFKNRQTAEAKQLQVLRETELRNQQMRQSAQEILNKTESTLKQLQDRVALRGNQDTQLDELNFTAREIRELAVKTDLSESEYAALVEKTKLWAGQVNDLNNHYARQDLLAQKANMKQLSPLVNNYLSSMENIYQQNPQSVILAEIVMNARKVADKIKEDETQLAAVQDSQSAQTIINRIQTNFEKVQKAHQYAQKLQVSLMNGGV